jgi:hypothetical protein
MRRQDLYTRTFGLWTVLDSAPSVKNETYWRCRCQCGKIVNVGTKNLTTGRSKSCGCATKELHGGSKSIEYAIWRRIWDRCTNPNNKTWYLYGGRGIKVEWQSFADFLADMGPLPSPLHSIDRYPDQDGPYSKDNCRWATARQQARNMRVNRMITANGETMCLAAWAEKSGISRNVIEKRLDVLCWSSERAVTQPVRR